MIKIYFRLAALMAWSLICANAQIAPPAPCGCPEGSRWEPRLNSCARPSCSTVPGMPDGDKGGNYFALGGTILQKLACVPTCGDLRATVNTGQPGWTLNRAPGQSAPKPAVVVSQPTQGWGSIPGASWISINASGGNAAGTYEYVFPFCLCPSARKLDIALSYLADNGVQVYLNTKLLQSTVGDRNFVAPAKSLTYSTVVGSGDAVVGTNLIRLIVSNAESVTGLLARLQLIAPGGACARGINSEALGQ